jgi:excinuclease ABC subunit B
VEVFPATNQVPHLLEQIRARVASGDRVLVTTLTKRLAEDLSAYLSQQGVSCKWLHSELDAFERVELLRDLREGKFDVLVGVNLLREGLDLPEVSLVAILDADKEGFLRSAGSLIQTIGRAARNVDGKAILYADKMTDSMTKAIGETDRRRSIQEAHNQKHNITPETVRKTLGQLLSVTDEALRKAEAREALRGEIDTKSYRTPEQIERGIKDLDRLMREAARALDFEEAAKFRDKIKDLKAQLARRA